MKQDGVFRAMNRTSKGNLYILAAALLWSTGGLIMKAVPFNGIVVNFFRTVFAFLFFAAMRRSFRIKINKTILLGAFCFFASTTFYACSNKMTTAANAIVLQYTAPMFVLAMQCVRERTLPKRRDVILLTAAFFGMILFSAISWIRERCWQYFRRAGRCIFCRYVCGESDAGSE